MKRKGAVGNNIYTAALIVIFVMTIPLLIANITRPPFEPLKTSLNNIVYLMKDSLDIAKSYLDNSARYSLYQASHDVLANGGFSGQDEPGRASHGDSHYILWYDGGDLFPSSLEIVGNIRSALDQNFSEYTGGERISALFSVGMPGYAESQIRKESDYGLELFIPSSSDLSLSRKTQNGDPLTVSRSADINLSLGVPLYGVLREAYTEYEYAKGGIKNCSVEDRSRDVPCCNTQVTVLSAEGTCLVRVSVQSKSEFPVYNGEKTVLEPLTLTFAEKAVMQADAGSAS